MLADFHSREQPIAVVVPILADLRREAPGAGVIRLADPSQAWLGDWQAGSPLCWSIEREAGGRALAFVIRCMLRLRAERQHSRRLEALVSAAERVGAAQSEEQLYQQLYEEACELLPGLDGFLIVRYDEPASEISFPFSYKHNKRIHIPPRSGGNSIAEYVLLTKEPLLLPYGDEMFRLRHGLNPPDENVGYSSSEIVVPMFPTHRLRVGRPVETLNLTNLYIKRVYGRCPYSESCIFLCMVLPPSNFAVILTSWLHLTPGGRNR